ncbi:hypothetical protein CC1G_05403 [Coprinopsis cinerea okayama7|uniref:Nephrocystin 3-like N-terminal domain-containing protein n=1 Tax=Coprinopsis cinerea (strain Okayama-7 / 130 / ATCC MYA-4618 / FGSC 9003) TaxID=240176 RepID=A8NPZ6_COPC7|nr:hypothetical protein CC1G_05403 [Coprinopsis cinerea okayama7\|eukprot:XP_001835441.2 hypothetical protein CC1G_05403 [Coprinopsis cinerea okayama7\
MPIASANSKRKSWNPLKRFRWKKEQPDSATEGRGTPSIKSVPPSVKDSGHSTPQTPALNFSRSFTALDDQQNEQRKPDSVGSSTLQPPLHHQAYSAPDLQKAGTLTKSVLKTSLEFLIQASDGLPIPLKGPLSLIKCLIDKAESVGTNRERLQTLEDHCRNLQAILEETLKDDDKLPDQLVEMLQALSSDLDSALVQMGAKDIAAITAFVSVQDINELITKIDQAIQKATDRFLISIGIYDAVKLSKVDINNRRIHYDKLQRRLAKHIASDATFDGFDPAQPTAKCAPGTREYSLRRFLERAKALKGKACEVIILTGAAGGGKTTLMRTASQQAHKDGLLAASFFFWSTSSTGRADYSKLAATLAYGLIVNVPALRPFILDAFAKDETIVVGKGLESQMRALLFEPVQEAIRRNVATDDWARLITIDGLDECNGQENQKDIVRIIDNVFVGTKTETETKPHASIAFPFLVAISSRPEPPARHAIERLFHGCLEHIDLDKYKFQTLADIERYLTDEFTKIREEHPMKDNLPPDWPLQRELEKLVENSSGQFIYPSTIIKFIGQERADPRDRLKLVLKWAPTASSASRNPFEILDKLYTEILTKAQKEYRENSDDRDPQAVVKLIRYVSHPNLGVDKRSADTLAKVYETALMMEPGSLGIMFYDIHSLIDTHTMELHHKTLIDFLSDESRCPKDMFVPEQKIRDYLAQCALTTLKRVLLSKRSNKLDELDESLVGPTLSLASQVWTDPSYDHDLVQEIDGFVKEFEKYFAKTWEERFNLGIHVSGYWDQFFLGFPPWLKKGSEEGKVDPKLVERLGARVFLAD